MVKNLDQIVKPIKAESLEFICRIRIGAVLKGMISFNQNLFMSRSGRERKSWGTYMRPPWCRHL
jgi:hypothetical protein